MSLEQAKAFKDACMDMNSISELRRALEIGPDAADMETWGINPEQWTWAIRNALREKLADSGSLNNSIEALGMVTSNDDY